MRPDDRFSILFVGYFISLIATFSTYPCYALVNGLSLKDAPDLVRLKFNNGWICSGAYVDEYTILTAAHCITGDAKENLQIVRIESNDDERLSVTVTELIPNPHFKAQSWPAYDIGIIKTSRNNKFTGKFKVTRNSTPFCGHAMLFGAGRTNPLSQTVSRTSGSNDFIKIGSVIFFLSSSKNSHGSTGINASVAPNDSGAPVTNEELQVIGVATTTTAKESFTKNLPILSTATSVNESENNDFIYAHLGPTSESKDAR